MVGQLNLNQLRTFAPQSPILVFRPVDSGSPMQDWCRHLSENAPHRRELEEFAVLADVVVEIPIARTTKVITIFLLCILACFHVLSTDDKSQYDHAKDHQEDATKSQ